MNLNNNLNQSEAIDKLKSLVDDINICLFCTNLKTDAGATCRPMGAQKVCDEGNIWFFSEKHSDKNNEIVKDRNVQLFFAHPGIGSYLVINGEAEIIVDRYKTDELWSPLAKIWFPEGKNDPNISIIKVNPRSAYYWDADSNKMINFFKMLASVAPGSNLVSGTEGAINLKKNYFNIPL